METEQEALRAMGEVCARVNRDEHRAGDFPEQMTRARAMHQHNLERRILAHGQSCLPGSAKIVCIAMNRDANGGYTRVQGRARVIVVRSGDRYHRTDNAYLASG